ncbi:hypothetical protein LTS12_010984 [Elasticomyces elasticus]|nr:hypothetical protein LTS12_010984 [Elasticomyces elasticus]
MAQPGRHAPLLAAKASSSLGNAGKDGPNNNPNQDPRLPGGRQKRTLIESACSACRRRKSRCDGERPFCSRCVTLRTECTYEAEEGESRWSALRRRNQILETERSEIRELISYLQNRPEPEAQDIFQRLRNGPGPDDFFTLLRQLRQGSDTNPPEMQQRPALTHQASSASTSSNSSEQRLPPVSTLFDAASGASPMTLPRMENASGPQGLPSRRRSSQRSHSSGGSDSSRERDRDHPFRPGM